MADATHLRIVVAVQVQRDSARAVQLAADLGGTVLAFNGGDHSSQETAVRALYRTSAIVLGDRLHGLIVGATEGAVPLGWLPSSGGKIRQHFDAVEMPRVGQFEGRPADTLPVLTTDQIAEYARELATSVDRARDRIKATEQKARLALTGSSMSPARIEEALT